MTDEEFWQKLDDAIQNPDLGLSRTEAVTALLEVAYEEDLTLLCAVIPDFNDDDLVRHIILGNQNKRYFAVFSTEERYQKANIAFPMLKLDIRLIEMSCRDVLDDLLSRKEPNLITGLIFNPHCTRGALDDNSGFVVEKRLLTFAKEKPDPVIVRISTSKRHGKNMRAKKRRKKR